ncbi:endonuclease domain-containing protein [Variovorax sp. N23]|uniref:endonuclease domain-containing protein n=1 Tax=Variovorax sp. N23 TaxID=2980555 RepID=UPI0021CA50BD|nr:DUF559 domain-containing protein [Variovorax sp. N23]MCU4118425.1 DUF559 domain-containing protein [Variovorax sp. N23]
MKYPGQPKEPPSWYRDRGPSHIEEVFAKNLEDLADAIQAEHWFGDPEKHSRYRVDFLFKDARLVVELDGHEYHSTRDQLEKDAVRQRYLSRAGYTVIRFTGREIHRDAQQCVSEVRTIYRERIQRSPLKHRVLYIDYPFLRREMLSAHHFYRDLHPGRALVLTPLDEFIPHAVQWLHEKSFIAAFIFCSPEDLSELEALDGYVKEYEKGEVRLNVMPGLIYSLDLGEHLQSFSHLFDEYYLVADDPVYVTPLRSVLPKELTKGTIGVQSRKQLPNGKLLRKGNHETAFAGTDLAYVRWQDIWYPIASSMGLRPHEM